MAHLVAALAAPDISLPLLVVAAAQFALFARADMSLLLHVWRAHSQHYQQQQRQRLRQGRQEGVAAAAAATGRATSNNTFSSYNSYIGQSGVLSVTGLWVAAQQFLQRQLDRHGSARNDVSGLLEQGAGLVLNLVAGRSLVLLYIRLYLVLMMGESWVMMGESWVMMGESWVSHG
jgi:hypothetical protein